MTPSPSQATEPLFYAVDFGTSNSLLAAASDTQVFDPIPLQAFGSDPTILRSVIYTPQPDLWYFGDEAIQRYGDYGHEGRIFRSLKKFLPDAAFSGTHLHSQFYSLVDLISMFLKRLRLKGNEHFQRDVTQLVLGKPAVYSFDPEKEKIACQRMEAAAKAAGFKEISFCPEPVAAAYEFRSELRQKQTVMIADFGGGTSDFTVLRMDQHGFQPSDILAIGGLSIAGDAFDAAIMKQSISPHFGSHLTYRMPMGSNALKIPRNILHKLCSPADIAFLARADINQLLRDANRWSIDDSNAEKMNNLFTLVEEHLGYALFKEIEACKKALSSEASSHFQFKASEISISETISQSDFQSNSADLVAQIALKMDQTVEDAGVSYQNIDIVCCTGGTSHIPAIRAVLAQRFGQEKLRNFKHFDSVIRGLAFHAKQQLA